MLNLLSNETYFFLNSPLINRITEVMGLNYCILDNEGKILARNKIISDLFNNLNYANEIDPIAWQNIKEIMAAKKQTIIEEKYKNKYFLSIKHPILEKNKCKGIMIISLDITERKKAEIAKEDFIKSIHHDIKTPFFSIQTLSSVLAKNEIDSKKKEQLSIISVAAKRLSEYFLKILELKSLGNIHSDEKNSFNLKETIENVYDILKPNLLLKKLNFEINCPDIPITFNQMDIQQIILNLSQNAIKFTEKGKVTVKAEVKKDNLFISVKDTGIGISKDNQEIIFEKFKRVTPSYLEPEYKGCGLGLHIIKNIVEKLNRTICVNSSLNKGSEFIVTIPINEETK